MEMKPAQLGQKFGTENKSKPQIVEIGDRKEIIRIGQVDLVFVSQSHDKFKGELDPAFEFELKSSKTKAVVLEYFNEEIAQNASRVPLIGKKLHEIFTKMRNSQDFQFGEKIADICRDLNTPIVTMDIAMTPSYVANWAMFSVFTAGLTRIQEMSGWGMFGENRHEYEKLIPDMEDARRVFAAKGLKKMAEEFQPPKDNNVTDDNRPQIIICYPKAHVSRIADYLTNDSLLTRMAMGVKTKLYKLAPKIDWTIRTWKWKNMLANFTGVQKLAGWQKISNEKID
jgi:hypothetical protein